MSGVICKTLAHHDTVPDLVYRSLIPASIARMSYPQVTFKDVYIEPDCLVGRRREVVQEHTLQYQLEMLKSTGRYDAFKLKWHPVYDEPPAVPPIPNHLFWDSDVAKWIEGTCYFLQQCSMPQFDSAIRELVEMVVKAQQPDGYLNIHYTVVEPGRRFTNVKDMHELFASYPYSVCFVRSELILA